MESLAKGVVKEIQAHFPKEITAIGKIVTSHPDVIWAVPVLTAVVSTIEAFESAKKKKGWGTVLNTMSAVFSLVSAAGGLEMAKQMKDRTKMAGETEKRIRDAIKKYKESQASSKL